MGFSTDECLVICLGQLNNSKQDARRAVLKRNTESLDSLPGNVSLCITGEKRNPGHGHRQEEDQK